VSTTKSTLLAVSKGTQRRALVRMHCIYSGIWQKAPLGLKQQQVVFSYISVKLVSQSVENSIKYKIL